MDKFKSTDSLGIPIEMDDWRWFLGQSSNFGIYQALEAISRSQGENIILVGCVATNTGGTNYDITAGWIVLGGVLIYVEAHSIDIATEGSYEAIAATYDAAGDKTTQDANSIQTYQENRATATAALGGALQYNGDRFQFTQSGIGTGAFATTTYTISKGGSIFFYSPGSAVTLDTITYANVRDGDIVTIKNSATAYDITVDETGNIEITGKVATGTADVLINAGGTATFVYSSSSSKWFLVSQHRGAWQTPSYSNNWADGSSACKYSRDTRGRVTIEGALINTVQSGAIASNTAFTLPAGFRPRVALVYTMVDVSQFAGAPGTNHCIVGISTGGLVQISHEGYTTNDVLALGSITFDTV